MSQCGFCRGEGMIMMEGEQEVCPRCRGVGLT